MRWGASAGCCAVLIREDAATPIQRLSASSASQQPADPEPDRERDADRERQRFVLNG